MPLASWASERRVEVNCQQQDPHLQPGLWGALVEGLIFHVARFAVSVGHFLLFSAAPLGWGAGNLGNDELWGKRIWLYPVARVIVSLVGWLWGGRCVWSFYERVCLCLECWHRGVGEIAVWVMHNEGNCQAAQIFFPLTFPLPPISSRQRNPPLHQPGDTF